MPRLRYPTQPPRTICTWSGVRIQRWFGGGSCQSGCFCSRSAPLRLRQCLITRPSLLQSMGEAPRPQGAAPYARGYDLADGTDQPTQESSLFAVVAKSLSKMIVQRTARPNIAFAVSCSSFSLSLSSFPMCRAPDATLPETLGLLV